MYYHYLTVMSTILQWVYLTPINGKKKMTEISFSGQWLRTCLQIQQIWCAFAVCSALYPVRSSKSSIHFNHSLIAKSIYQWHYCFISFICFCRTNWKIIGIHSPRLSSVLLHFLCCTFEFLKWRRINHIDVQESWSYRGWYKS